MTEPDLTSPTIAAADQLADSISAYLGASYVSGNLSEMDDRDAFHERFNRRIVHLGLRRQRNLEAIFEAAFAAVGQSGTRDIDGDWLARFLSLAEQIGDRDMQQVWGFVLAREYQDAGSVSLPTLTCLSKMVSRDLELWERIGRMTYSEGYVFKVGGRNQFDRFEVSREDILSLQTIGLFQEAQDLSITFAAETRGLTFAYKGANLILRHPELTLFTLPAFRMSSAGIQLFNLLIDSPVNEDYLRALGTELKPHGYDYRLRLADGTLVE